MTAQLGGLIKKLADLGVSGTGKYAHEENIGVLQKDLAGVIKSGNDCRRDVFMRLVEIFFPTAIASQAPASPPPIADVRPQVSLGPNGWEITVAQAESLQSRVKPIFPKPNVFIKCRTMASDCDKFAFIIFDVLHEAGWPVAEPMTSRQGNVIITGEYGIMIISTNPSAARLKDAFQAQDAGGFPAELDWRGSDEQILINIGDRR